MAPVTDLTWQQLEIAAGTSLIVVDDNLGLLLNLSVLTGNVVTSHNASIPTSATGVVQALYRLREFAAAAAQATANAGQSIGERLAAFPPASNGTAVNGFVMSSGQIIVRTPLATTGILGARN